MVLLKFIEFLFVLCVFVMSYNDSTNRRYNNAKDCDCSANDDDRSDYGHSGGGFRLGRSNADDISGTSVSIRNLTPYSIRNLTPYRMALLGSKGIQRYLVTGYIPEDLLD